MLSVAVQTITAKQEYRLAASVRIEIGRSMASVDTNTWRILLLGNSGSGKSSLANTLFGEDVFPLNDLPNSDTKLCTSKTKTIKDRSIQLIDTHGFFDTDPRSTELSPGLLECITECAPGPHAFLLVIKMEEYGVLEKALALTLKYFSEEALKYTTVVFTHGDQLPEGMKIKQWVGNNKDVRNFVKRCGWRRHVIDNKCWNNSQDQYRNNQTHINLMLRTIDQTVRENRGAFYTNGLLHEFKYSENLLLENVEIGILLGAFLGAIERGVQEAESKRPRKNIRGGPQRSRWAPRVPSGPRWSQLGLAGIAFLAGKLSERWSSPTRAVQDLTEFSKEVENMFVQMKKTTEAIKGFAGAFSDSEKGK